MVCRKPYKIIDREFVNNFWNHVGPPPPRGKKKFIASDWVYKVLSRNYWAKKTNLRVTHKQVESPPWSKKQFHSTLTHL